VTVYVTFDTINKGFFHASSSVTSEVLQNHFIKPENGFFGAATIFALVVFKTSSSTVFLRQQSGGIHIYLFDSARCTTRNCQEKILNLLDDERGLFIQM